MGLVNEIKLSLLKHEDLADKMIANAGFTHFAWIGPEEKFEDAQGNTKLNEFLQFGGFGYAKQTEESRKQTEESRKNLELESGNKNLKLEEKGNIFLPIIGAKMYVADTILFQVTAKVCVCVHMCLRARLCEWLDTGV